MSGIRHKESEVTAIAAMPSANILVTGGAGFIGSNFVKSWLEESRGDVVTVDKGTYAAGSNGASETTDQRHRFVVGDIADRALIKELLRAHQPAAVINFAAETHVDRSILFPEEFVQANV